MVVQHTHHNNILKVILGKTFKLSKQVKKAYVTFEIYNI